MKILLFTHKNDIDGMGNAVLSKLAFDDVDYVLCGTFDLTKNVMKYIEDGSIYDYDFIFVTDLCMEEPLLSMIDGDERLKGKVLDFDHHRTFMDSKYTKYDFINVCVSNDNGLCCGTSLFYEYLVSNNYIDSDNLAIKEFVELTRQHDTWEWKNIYNNEKARELSILFDAIGCCGYIDLMVNKLGNKDNINFFFNDIERLLIDNRLILISDKIKYYCDNIFYRDILGLRAGIIFITYEFRNELAQYFKDNNYDMDFCMMIALDPGVCCYRSVRDGVNVREVAEYFGGKGHNTASSNPITSDMKNNFIKVLTKKI